MLVLLWPMLLVAQDNTRWVTDSFEVTMRTEKNSRAKIIRMLPSGTRLEVLETDPEAGYARVKTRSGAEGWVLLRYLESATPARVALPAVQQRLNASEENRKKAEQEARQMRQERDALQKQIDRLENNNQGIQRDLDSIRRMSSNVVQIDEENKTLRQRMAENDRIVAELEEENRRLGNRSDREWFIVGAAVVIVGMLLGLILPRIRWRRKSSWSDF